MKFSLKLLLWTTIVLAIALGISGFYFVNFVFETSLNREVRQALDESSILRFAFETAALNVPAKYGVLQDHTVEQLASNMETGGQNSSRLLRISDEEQEVLYASTGFETDTALLAQTGEKNRTYEIIRQEDSYFIQTASRVNALDRILYLETMKDVSAVFKERALGFSVYRKVTGVMLACGTLIMLLVSSWLTKPIRLLTKATKRMSAGDYDYRAKQVSNDELGQLTSDFNKMSEVLEENIKKLEHEIRAREDFVAAFAHELKTPLTSIIGYADLLRSRKLDEEKSFLSANYIYTEGKRLEAMSFRLLDLIVTKRQQTEIQFISAEVLLRYVKDMFALHEELKVEIEYEPGKVRAEADLIITVLINLTDNACKASEPGGVVEVTGQRQEDGYLFSVKDYGIGIPEDEVEKITEAFYMVDKSRARSKNGAGLGLSLCVEILKLHGSSLRIESKPGEGSCISFFLPDQRQEEGGQQNEDEKISS